MAKKKSAKKASNPVKSRRGKAVPRRTSTPKNLKQAKRPTSPRSQVLPGMEQVRNRSLDRICEGISDTRADLNKCRGEEKELVNQAVKVMTTQKVTAYRFSGVELVLVPGDVHLRVRTLKTGANSDPSPQDATTDDMTEEPEDVEDVAQAGGHDGETPF
jgi:hypothetical protein